MTRPRCLLRNETYMLTRRCKDGMFLLKYDPRLRNLFRYLLALYAQKWGIRIHAFILMSNHYHLIVSENPESSRIPLFERDFNLAMTRGINALYGRAGAVWDERPYNAVWLVDKDTIIDRIAYVIANPVKAGLVETPEIWLEENLGLVTLPEDLGRKRISGSRTLRGSNSSLPMSARLKLSLPPKWQKHEAPQFRTAVQKRVNELVEEYRLQRGEEPFLGVEAIRSQAPTDRPQHEPEKPYSNPVVACTDASRRKDLKKAFQSFYKSYREAWDLWKTGLREVLFPVGTYAMRVLHKAPCTGIVSGFGYT